MAFTEQFNYLVSGHLKVSSKSHRRTGANEASRALRLRKVRTARRVYKDILRTDRILGGFSAIYSAFERGNPDSSASQIQIFATSSLGGNLLSIYLPIGSNIVGCSAGLRT